MKTGRITCGAEGIPSEKGPKARMDLAYSRNPK